jgi:ADP-ribose pyrophosphatase YjhB (NUDIX family)
MKELNKAVPAAYLFLVKDRKLLLMLRKNTSYYDGWYTVPAGHIEAGELPSEALAREAREELGIVFDPRDAKFVHAMYRDRHDETGQRADYFFVVEAWSGEPRNAEPDKCEEVAWFPLDALPEKFMRHVRDALRAWQEGRLFTEMPFNESYVNPTVRVP